MTSVRIFIIGVCVWLLAAFPVAAQFQNQPPVPSQGIVGIAGGDLAGAYPNPVVANSLLHDSVGGNLALGIGALSSITLPGATGNTAVGVNALNLLTNSTATTAIGNGAAQNTTAHAVTAVGSGSAKTVTTAVDTIAIGVDALNNDDGSGSTTGVDNVAVGVHAQGHLTTGGFNVAIGNDSMVGCGNYVGNPSPTCLLTGGNNTSLGHFTLGNIQGAASENTAFGYSAGSKLTTGTENIFIGSYTGVNSITTGNMNILIGRDIRVPSDTSDGQLNIGNLIIGTGLTQGGATSNGTVTVNGTLTSTRALFLSPPASNAPTINGQCTFQLTSDTQIAIKCQGSDGIIRSNTLTLSWLLKQDLSPDNDNSPIDLNQAA